jgi:polyphenol oxidase
VKPVFHDEQIIGKESKFEKFHVFFGNRFASSEILKQLYPDYEFSFLKQVHGNKIVSAPSNEEADGQWTDRSRVALAINTADCLPVMIYNEGIVTALHAGWRGIASRIILESAKVLGTVDLDARAFVGPHLQFENFEVHHDVAEKLKNVGPPGAAKIHQDPAKCYVDLSLIAKFQLEKLGVGNISIDKDNTFANNSYVSYRFNGPGCGRLISFIAKL